MPITHATEWQLVHGTQESKPAELDISSSSFTVYQRRNISRVSLLDEEDGSKFVEQWEYEERQIPKEEFVNYYLADLINKVNNLEETLCDLDLE